MPISSLCNFPIKRKIITPPGYVEPEPIFATSFNDTVFGPAVAHTLGAASFTFSGNDSGFGPPFALPLNVQSDTSGFAPGYGIQYLKTDANIPNFSQQNAAGVAERCTVEKVDSVIRGVSSKSLKFTLKAPGVISNYYSQMWFVLRRLLNADLPAVTIRYDIKLPTITDVVTQIGGSSGRYVLLDIKTTRDFRYVVDLIYNGSQVFFHAYADNWANYYSQGPAYWDLSNTIASVPQNNWFGIEYSWQRPTGASHLDHNTGRFRVRARLPGAPDGDYTPILDINNASVAAWNAAYGTSYVNKHAGVDYKSATPANGYVHRIMHGLYGRFKDVDASYEMDNYRLFNSFLDP